MGKQRTRKVSKASGPFYIYRDGDSLIGIMDTYDAALGYKVAMEVCYTGSTFEVLSGLKIRKEETEG